MSSVSMRWFKDQVLDGVRGSSDQAWRAYRSHLEEIVERLPAEVRRAVTDPDLDLHDNRILELLVDGGSREVSLVTARDRGTLVRILEFRFTGASIVPEDRHRLTLAISAEFPPNQWTSRRTTSVVHAAEYDLDTDGGGVLRIRLFPFHLFAVRFRDLRISSRTEPAPRARHGGRVRSLSPP